MDAKKNPKKDMSRNSGVFFAAGMAMVLALTYVALEWKTFYGCYDDEPTVMVHEEDITEDPIVIHLPEPKPKPIITPPVIEIIPDEIEVPETIIEAAEPNQDTEVIEVDEVVFVEVEEEVDVIWRNIEEVPVFPGCENDADKRECFNKMMEKHIRKIFRYPSISKEMGVEGKVYTQFTIQKDGNIGNILLRGPDKNLEKEAQRIISNLPKMKPGKQRDKNVKVAFTIPISFKLNN